MLNQVYQVILYFSVGFIFDVLATLDTQCVIDVKPLRSGFLSFTITLLSVLVISSITLSGEITLLALSYALGSASGSYLTIKRKRRH
jgi:hypothetical protein